MNIENMVQGIVWLLIIIYFFRTMFKKEEEKDIPTLLITGGLSIFFTDIDFLLNLVNSDSKGFRYTDIIQYVFGLTLIVIGSFISYREKKQYHVFNLLGENNKIELIKNDFKVKNIKTGIVRERSIDFMLLLESQKMNEKTNELINKIIRRETETINNYPVKDNIYLTSMAAIPYTVLFGTYLSNRSNIKYINYNRLESEFELLPNEIKKRKRLNINVEKDFCESRTNSSNEVLVSISGTFHIHETDLSKFDVTNQVKISFDNIIENNLSSQQEIVTIANEIVNELINISKRFSSIHVAAAIPGMLSLELGRCIKNRENQLQQIIFYHYIAQYNSRYKYGIVVNGNNKEELIKKG